MESFIIEYRVFFGPEKETNYFTKRVIWLDDSRNDAIKNCFENILLRQWPERVVKIEATINGYPVDSSIFPSTDDIRNTNFLER